MTHPAGDEQPLPAARAFVVQLQRDAHVARGHWAGRIAHVVSGESTHFATLEELVVFIARILARDAGRPAEP